MIVKDHFNRSVSRIGAIKKLEKFDELATLMAILEPWHGRQICFSSHYGSTRPRRKIVATSAYEKA
jgi:hypothetical protein